MEEYRKNEDRLRQLLITVIILTGTLVGVCTVLGQYYHYRNPVTISLSDYESYTGEFSCSLDSVKRTNPKYDEISGWIAAAGKSPDEYDTRLVLYTDNSDTAWMYPVKMVKRKDVSFGKEDELDYTNCGFSIKLDRACLPGSDVWGTDLKIGVIMSIDGERYVVRLNKYFSTGADE